MTKSRRLVETKRLSEILPGGREGGLEFARIVDLLLFHEARRHGRNLTLFSDRSGDYQGLDSFEGGDQRKESRVGYQYKFYSSPLSASHRSEIKQALIKVQEANNKRKSKQKISKWILITPDDLSESGRRKAGGDVSWFDGLKDDLKLEFEIEHWGHRKLQAMFLETPFLCLFYYPELVPEGVSRRKTIEETRLSYDKNLRDLYGRIEFVGMSVYKPEATRGVLMEHIYIPLSTIAEQADDRDSSTPRVNPLELLLPAGGRHVILGDPGSGKSTLLKFLALAGSSVELQNRYGFVPDKRLPVLVVLRRYADALKSEPDLPLLTYVLRNLQADLSLPHADLPFFEFYLESGKAMLLFDGMDELPNPKFKQTVRDRIHSLLNTYPGNTAIVTSRIVGYENPHRFDDKTYQHHKVARLAQPEIERFVTDWYAARIENETERRANVSDLIRILRDSQQQAIGELASNPLLLTIIALVHRIDAVLPDERVVLYQKCTETLLNTWHTWKFRADDMHEKRGKIERRNRCRIEALAYWMHQQAGSSKAKERAIVSYDAACGFLVKHIQSHERGVDADDVQDEAEDFLDFVRSRAGLLIEVGDRQYSFVHLTFQEYLSATDLTAQMEIGGVEALWKRIASITADPRWHEVLRLLIAELRSGDSQLFLVQKLLLQAKKQYEPHSILLLGGVLLDGIEAAEQEGVAICELLFASCLKEQGAEVVGRLLKLLHGLGSRAADAGAPVENGFLRLWHNKPMKTQQALAVAWLAAGLDEQRLVAITGNTLNAPAFEWMRLLLLTCVPHGDWSSKLKKELGRLPYELAPWVTASPATNAIAGLVEAIFPPVLMAELSYQLRLYSMACAGGPFEDFGMAPSYATVGGGLSFPQFTVLTDRRMGGRRSGIIKRVDTVVRSVVRGQPRERAGKWAQLHSRDIVRAQKNDLEHRVTRFLINEFSGDSDEYWTRLLSDNGFTDTISKFVLEALQLQPRALWEEAIRVCFVPQIPKRLRLYQSEVWQQTEAVFTSGSPDKNALYAAAWMLLYDVWLYANKVYQKPENSPFARLSVLTKDMDFPPLRVAHLLRDAIFGDTSKVGELKALVKSDDSAYRNIFESAFWAG